jgi:hypothetical protein
MTVQHDAVALWKSNTRERLHRARTAARGFAMRSVGAIPPSRALAHLFSLSHESFSSTVVSCLYRV